ncbi:MAG: hypothetical protein IJW59_05545 [Clostridia bacterium]|nr:hypothetical protein [Clostridia bacterium]
MWEVTLIGYKKDLMYLAILEEQLMQNLVEVPIIAMVIRGEEVYCSIATDSKKSIKYIKSCILETIIKICKEEYFRENIKILGSDKYLNDFILTSLTYVDIQDEVEFATIRFKFTPRIHIRSLVRFKLSKLYNVWKKFAIYFNSSLNGIIKDQIYLEFLKFLASNMVEQNDIIYVEENNNSLAILDKDRNVVKKTHKSDEIDLIVSLIMFSPKKLVINCLDNFSNNVSAILKYIFEDKICLIL